MFVTAPMAIIFFSPHPYFSSVIGMVTFGYHVFCSVDTPEGLSSAWAYATVSPQTSHCCSQLPLLYQCITIYTNTMLPSKSFIKWQVMVLTPFIRIPSLIRLWCAWFTSIAGLSSLRIAGSRISCCSSMLIFPVDHEKSLFSEDIPKRNTALCILPWYNTVINIL